MLGSSNLDPPGPIGSWKIAEFSSGNRSGGLYDRSLDNDAGIDVFPQRDEPLASERDNRRLLEATAVPLDPVPPVSVGRHEHGLAQHLALRQF